MFKKKKTKKLVYEFPRNFKELGYCVNEEGQLRTLEGEPYKFEVREKDRPYNEGLYDTLLGLMGEWIEESLQKDHEMIKTLVPLGAKETDIHSRIYLSPDYMTNDKMMIFIPGTSNTVGIWSKRVLADESIVEGSMIAYAKRAKELGFSVVITNPNEVFWYKDKAVLILPKTTVEFNTIPGSESPEAHTNYVFENFVIPSAAQDIVIVANSYGGHCAVDVMQNHFGELSKRVKAIEFTASTHSIDFVKTDKMKVWIREHCRNWLMSDQPVGKEVYDTRFGCISVSSASDLNDFVTSMVIDQVFDFVENKILNPDNSHNEDNGEDLDEILNQDAEKLISIESLSSLGEITDIQDIQDIQDLQDRIQFNIPKEIGENDIVYEGGW